jgi:Outer membrane efflux protein
MSRYSCQCVSPKVVNFVEVLIICSQSFYQPAECRFKAGVGTQTDRISAETDLTHARGNQITAILGYNRAIAQLQRAVSGSQPGSVLTASAVRSIKHLGNINASCSLSV